MKKSACIFLSIVAFAVVSGCGSPDENGPDTGIPDVSSDVINLDIRNDVAGDVQADAVADSGDRDTAGDIANPDAGDATDVDSGDLPFDAADVADAADAADVVDVAGDADVVEPGVFGWPCTADSECVDGPCVTTDDGKVCSMDCTHAVCPDGFSCVPYAADGSVATLICMPSFLNVCTPCVDDGDCVLGLASTAGMACRNFGPEAGSFCVPPCVDECPDGYECRASGLGDGKSWCLPLSGECGCSWLATGAGAVTDCSVGTAGIETRCAGTRTCGIDGLSECSAAAPDGEKCNGVDDDCDGLTDEAGAVDCTIFYFDLDNDGQGLESVARCYCSAQGTYRATTAGDCDDSNPSINSNGTEACNDIDDDCDGVTDEPGATRCRNYYQDNDGDGVGGDSGSLCLCSPSDDFPLTSGGDCDDTSMFVAPGVDDICNGIDDDCDGVTDPVNATGCFQYYLDNDDDTYGNSASSSCLCAPSGKFTAVKVGDCNDVVATINPGITETCNGVDDNCDLVMDPEDAAGCSAWFADRDDDGWGVMWDSRCLCRSTGDYSATDVGDCDDGSADIRPDAYEICGNNIDEDCDASVSEAGALLCIDYYADGDQDGFGAAASFMCLCAPAFPYTTTTAGDCDDLSGSVSPTSLEVCANAADDDCDGSTDEAGCSGCATFYLDVDRDGFGVMGSSACLSSADEATGYVARVPGDCADGNNQVHPGAVEKCNGADDDCDGLTDPDGAASCIVFYFDYDGDGYGVTANSRCLCAPDGNYSAVDDGDCDDLNAKVGGGAETCNGVDDNCNGRVDEENAVGCSDYYLDDDGDGVGVDGASKCLCSASGLYSTKISGDCDDTSVSVRPGAADTCNGVDDDCDGVTDPEGATGCQYWYRDFDGDGYGVIGLGKCLCASTTVYVTKKTGDCNDSVRVISPAGIESCNGVDDNCDGSTDSVGALGCSQYYADRDVDGWGNSNDHACLCAASAPWIVNVGGDCNDGSALVGPGGQETCNSLDDDCDGTTDEYGATGCVFYFLDTDRDGFGVAGSDLCSCRAEGLRDAAVGGDCDDSNTAFNPAATEVCNGVDDNCDGLKDPAGAAGCLVYMADRDSDGFGVAGDTSCLCAPTYPYTSLISGDCDDTRALARPGRVETCNGFDDNCDGLTDLENSQGCLVYYRDADADGYALSGDFKCLCAATAPYLQPEPNGDCDDTNPEANAGKSEVCDGADNDCDGATDENNTQDCLRRYLDVDADGWGVTADWVCGCGVTAPYTATKGGDCDDSRPLVAPGKTEVCDGLDNNCDDATDPVDTVGCVAYYVDWDRDGYGVDSDTRCQCSASGSYSATAGGDCNDFNSRVSPGVAEKCGNSLDDDCDGYESEAGAEGCSTYYLDYDTDGFGDSASAQCLCSPGIEYRTTTGGDCCDRDDTTYPFAAGWHTTINNCNSWDFDCNGSVLKRWNADDAGCGGWGIGDGCDLHVGWSGSVPACGASGTYIYDGCGYCGFLWLNCCSAQKVARTQECY